MAWTNLTFSFGAILTSAQMTQLDDNFDAMAGGLPNAPRLDEKAVKAYKLCAYPASGYHYMKANKRSLILAIGGGGSGGANYNDAAAAVSGGSAGDLVWKDTTPVSDETLTIAIGSGGSAATSNSNGNAGSNTTITGTTVNITAAGGPGGLRSATTIVSSPAAPTGSTGGDGVLAGGVGGAVTGGSGNLATGGGSVGYDASSISSGTGIRGAGGNPQSTTTLGANEVAVEQYFIGELNSIFSTLLAAVASVHSVSSIAAVGGDVSINALLTSLVTNPSIGGQLKYATGIGAGSGGSADGAASRDAGGGSFGGGGGGACTGNTSTVKSGAGGDGLVLVLQEI